MYLLLQKKQETKINIAVIIDNKITSGGGFQASLSLISILNSNKSEDYNFIFYTTINENVSFFKKRDVKISLINIGTVDKIYYFLKSNKVFRHFLKFIELKLDIVFKKDNVDLVYFVTQSSLYKYTENYNFIYTLWDLCHRDFPEFPEVCKNNEFNSRDFHLSSLLPKATHIFTESELGKLNVIRRYSVDERRVSALPMIPSESTKVSDRWLKKNYLDIKQKYSIKNDYIFYPAQFWAHKNHIYILEGLKILKEEFNIELSAVFSGSDHGNKEYIKESACALNIEDLIHFIGFVENNEIPFLYKQAIALVMPTYFGPTNIPPFEASLYKCPILYSDLPGLRDQMENKALFLDLLNPKSLALNLNKVLNNDEDIQSIVQHAYDSIQSFDKSLHWNKLKVIFDQYKILQKTWKA